jgi:hypothetical protein
MATSDISPTTPTIDPIDQPQDSDSPTDAMLKADFDSGATGDKTEVFDPRMVMLGAREEAAGAPPTPAQFAWARHQETIHRWRNAVQTGTAHNKRDGFPTFFVSFIVLVGVVLVREASMVRRRSLGRYECPPTPRPVRPNPAGAGF